MPVAFQIEDILPDVDFLGGDLIIKTGISAVSTGQVKKYFFQRLQVIKLSLVRGRRCDSYCNECLTCHPVFSFKETICDAC